ncbi:MAG: PH domain-containing protein [Acidobacteriota bacterium]
MGTASASLRDSGIDTTSADGAVLTVRPDMRIVKFSFLGPVLVLAAGILAYLWPPGIDRDFQLAGAALIAGIGVVGLACLLSLYEGLAKARYTVTNEYIEEEYGIIYKRLRRIPLSYVRDVTYDQNFFQSMFGVSSLTVSPTNGNKIVLNNLRDGEGTREAIWEFVLSRSPQARGS